MKGYLEHEELVRKIKKGSIQKFSIGETLGYICSRKVDQRLLRVSTPLEELHATDVPSPTNDKKG